jgi:uncharacterized RDD family membrane protein YckC
MELASRFRRLAAQLVDAALLTALALASMLSNVLPGPVLVLCAVSALGLAVAQLVLLARRGQTVGKILFGLRIVRKETGENGGFIANVLLRTVLNGLLSMNPIYLLVDCCLIFRSDRRCLHDLLAGTVVVDAPVERHAPGSP